jgi:hypothetical protein
VLAALLAALLAAFRAALLAAVRAALLYGALLQASPSEHLCLRDTASTCVYVTPSQARTC